MQSPPPEKYTYPQRVPESTNDVNLKRARVVDNDGKSYIRVTGTVTSSDLDPIKEALGEPTDTSSDNTVIGLLKKIDVKQFGVGQAYPGSTGGEIFNYYDTDSDKNVASGDYSTAIGLKNTSAGDYSFTAGNNNETHSTSSMALGEHNVITNVDNVCAIGEDNTVNTGNHSVVIGRNNVSTQNNVCIVGRGIQTSSKDCTYVGSYNDSQNDGNINKFVVGVGSSTTPKTAIRCTNSYTKISTPLRLNYDSTEVDAITAPLSSPASTDDKTLATKAYVDANGGFTPEKTEIFAMYPYSTSAPPVDLGEIPYQKGRIVLRGTLDMPSYTSSPTAEATFEASFDLTTSPQRIDSLVQQTIFSYDTNKFVAVTLTIQFFINPSNHLIITLMPDTSTAGVVFYDQNRVAQGHDVPSSNDIVFDTMSSHSYFYNY